MGARSPGTLPEWRGLSGLRADGAVIRLTPEEAALGLGPRNGGQQPRPPRRVECRLHARLIARLPGGDVVLGPIDGEVRSHRHVRQPQGAEAPVEAGVGAAAWRRARM